MLEGYLEGGYLEMQDEKLILNRAGLKQGRYNVRNGANEDRLLGTSDSSSEVQREGEVHPKLERDRQSFIIAHKFSANSEASFSGI